MKLLPFPLFSAASLVILVSLSMDPSRFFPGGLIVSSFSLVFAAGTYWWSSRLKWVSVDSENLYVSSWRKEVSIPLGEIESVYDVTAGYPVFVRLKSASTFGCRIVFIATQHPFFMFSSHPIVADLNGLVKKANESKDAIQHTLAADRNQRISHR